MLVGVPAGGLEDVGKPAHDVLVGQELHEGVLELVWDEVAAFGIAPSDRALRTPMREAFRRIASQKARLYEAVARPVVGSISSPVWPGTEVNGAFVARARSASRRWARSARAISLVSLSISASMRA